VHKGHNKAFFSNKAVNRWNLLDQQRVDSRSLNALTNGLYWIRINRMGSSWTSPLSPGIAGGGPAGEAAVG